MKKINAIVLGACFFLLMLWVGPSYGTAGGIRLFGGINYFSPVDINKGVKGWSDLHAEFLTRTGYTRSGDAEPVQFGIDAGGDLLFSLTPGIAIGIGAGYIQGVKESEIVLSKDTEISMTNKVTISAVPIRLGLFFSIPLTGHVNLSFNVGPGYYLAKYRWDWDFQSQGEIHHSATAAGWGLQGGIGFEFDLSSNTAFFLEGTARYAKIKGFEGTIQGREIDDRWEGDGILYYVEGTQYPALFIQQDQPTGYRVAREAQVDFSGFAVVAGLKMKF